MIIPACEGPARVYNARMPVDDDLNVRTANAQRRREHVLDAAATDRAAPQGGVSIVIRALLRKSLRAR